MTDAVHRYRVGQTVDLIASTFRSAATGSYEIIGLRPADGEEPQYRIKSKSEAYERIVPESSLILTAKLQFGAD